MAIAWNWITTNGTGLGVVISLGALVAAIVAAWAGIHYGRRGLSQGRDAMEQGQAQAREAMAQAQEAQRVADERYERDIAPRPRLGSFQPSPYDVPAPKELSVDVINTGGAALHVLVLVELVGRIYAAQTSLPVSGLTGVRFVHKAVVSGGGSPEPRPRILAAQDIQGRWWDCEAGQILEEDLLVWWEKRAKESGVAMVALFKLEGGRYQFSRVGVDG
jgi:hypothetical protein